jgi:hypothetical protein
VDSGEVTTKQIPAVMVAEPVRALVALQGGVRVKGAAVEGGNLLQRTFIVSQKEYKRNMIRVLSTK